MHAYSRIVFCLQLFIRDSYHLSERSGAERREGEEEKVRRKTFWQSFCGSFTLLCSTQVFCTTSFVQWLAVENARSVLETEADRKDAKKLRKTLLTLLAHTPYRSRRAAHSRTRYERQRPP